MKIARLFLLPLLAASSLFAVTDRDIVVYGGNAAGVMTAVQASRLGRSVVLIEPGRHLGGLTASGLGATDIGRKTAIGGLAREFYQRMHAHYRDPAAWRNETREAYLPRHPDAIDEGLGMQFFFEPSVATRILEEFLAKEKVTVVREARLLRDRAQGIRLAGGRIAGIRTEDGQTFTGRVFIDCSYEGDLMALAGVSYRIGREPNSLHNETLNGIRYLEPDKSEGIDPFVRPGDRSSGTLPGVDPVPPGPEGEGDHRTQAYNFRVTLTDNPANRLPFTKPERYDPALYELLARRFAIQPKATVGPSLFKLTPMPNRKTDSNNQGGISTDWVGFSHDWAEASHAEREKIHRAHRDYVQGYFWFLANDPRVPAAVRAQVTQWGYPRDEFSADGHFPWQLYVREARRMIGAYVITEHDCTGARVSADSIGLASYPMDSHQVSRFVDEQGRLRFEGAFWKTVPPYPVSYRAITPKREQVANLLVPVALSATHAAYGSIRMEPVFMILGQSAATAAHFAIEQGVAVQDIPYDRLRARLLADGQVLEVQARSPSASAPAVVAPAAAPKIDSLEQAVAELGRREQLTDPDYWLAQARGGLIIRGARLREVVIRAALRQGGAEAAANLDLALGTLRKAGVFENLTYWETRLKDDFDCDGKVTADLLIKLARLP
jgi:hypothetical protein